MNHTVKIDDFSIVVSGLPYIIWLDQNNITGYHWTQNYNITKSKSYLTFRFENEHDKLLFALRWA